MIDTLAVQVRTALSPEWDRGFDEAFTELVTGDPDLVRDEFDAIIGANWNEPPAPPAEPSRRAEPSDPPGGGEGTVAQATDQFRADAVIEQRPPP